MPAERPGDPGRVALRVYPDDERVGHDPTVVGEAIERGAEGAAEGDRVAHETPLAHRGLGAESEPERRVGHVRSGDAPEARDRDRAGLVHPDPAAAARRASPRAGAPREPRPCVRACPAGPGSGARAPTVASRWRLLIGRVSDNVPRRARCPRTCYPGLMSSPDLSTLRIDERARRGPRRLGCGVRSPWGWSALLAGAAGLTSCSASKAPEVEVAAVRADQGGGRRS